MNRQATSRRFQSTWDRISSSSNGDVIGRELFARYAESNRFYHTIDHIDYCLGMFDKVRKHCVNPDAVELAIWFHDVVYDFPANENERLSAEYFMDVSRGRLPEALRRIVFDQVIATDHRSLPVDQDQKIMIDIDLSSFGRQWEQFLHDGVNVRKEMDFLADDEFYSRQIAFMKSLLAREHFYATDWFQRNFEASARQNLTRYLASLADRGYVE